MYVPWFAPFAWWWFVATAMSDRMTGEHVIRLADEFMKEDTRRQFSPDRKGVKSDPY